MNSLLHLGRQLGNPGPNNSSNQSGLSLAHEQWFTVMYFAYIIPGIYIFIFIFMGLYAI